MISLVCVWLLASLLSGFLVYSCVSKQELPKWKRWMIVVFVVLWPLGWMYACVTVIRVVVFELVSVARDLYNWLAAD